MGEWVSETMSGEDHYNYKGKIEKVCENCGEVYGAYPYRADRRMFCSPSCRHESFYMLLGGEKNPHWKGGYESYYGPNWEAQRKKARRRDNFQCESCGVSEDEMDRELDVHHIAPFRTFVVGDEADYEEANRLKNLVSLCSSCHQQWEQMSPLRPDTGNAAAD